MAFLDHHRPPLHGHHADLKMIRIVRLDPVFDLPQAPWLAGLRQGTDLVKCRQDARESAFRPAGVDSIGLNPFQNALDSLLAAVYLVLIYGNLVSICGIQFGRSRFSVAANRSGRDAPGMGGTDVGDIANCCIDCHSELHVT